MAGLVPAIHDFPLFQHRQRRPSADNPAASTADGIHGDGPSAVKTREDSLTAGKLLISRCEGVFFPIGRSAHAPDNRLAVCHFPFFMRHGITRGAPDAMQVAGRFHILQNLGEALEMVLDARTKNLRTVARAHAADYVGQDGAG